MSKIESLDPIFRNRIAERDKLHLSPNERAERVNTFIFLALGYEDPADVIKQPLYFDLICYCFEMLNLYALGSQDEVLAQLTQVINKHMYSQYYSLDNDNKILGPDKETHINIWKERIEAF